MATTKPWDALAKELTHGEIRAKKRKIEQQEGSDSEEESGEEESG